MLASISPQREGLSLQSLLSRKQGGFSLNDVVHTLDGQRRTFTRVDIRFQGRKVAKNNWVASVGLGLSIVREE